MDRVHGLDSFAYRYDVGVRGLTCGKVLRCMGLREGRDT